MSYFIHPPRIDFAETMTAAEDDAWGRHWQRIQRLYLEGRIILVGPTLGRHNTGICVFEADDEDAARQVMDEDPAIAGGFATAELRRSGCRSSAGATRPSCESASASEPAPDPAQGTRGTSGRRANASMNRPIIFVAATRSSIRMFSSGACARQSARPAPSVVAGTRCCAQTWYIGTVPGNATPMLAVIPVTSLEDGGRGLDDRVGRRRPPGGLGLAHDHVDVAEPVLVEVAPQRVDDDPRVLVRDEPDVEPRVRLVRRDVFGVASV